MLTYKITNVGLAFYVAAVLLLSTPSVIAQNTSVGVPLQGGAAAASSLPTPPPPLQGTSTRPRLVTPPVIVTSSPTTTSPLATIETEAGDELEFDPPPIFNQGVVVETLDGRTVMEQAPNQSFNPASAIKLATALAALRTLGPQHRFATGIWTNGSFDRLTGTLDGDLIVSGRDPSFHYQHAVQIAHELNRQGIRTVTGDLVVAPFFTMNFGSASLRSGENFYDTLDHTRRPAAATRAWLEDQRLAAASRLPATNAVASLMNMGVNTGVNTNDDSALQTAPSVAVMGAVYVGAVPAGARLLLTHRSSELVDVLKVLLCYSNNFMAERLGDTLGGKDALQRFLVNTVRVNPLEVHVASASGLGSGRITPRAMLKVYRALLVELARHNLSPSDIMPVAGIDPGTLQKRYNYSPGRGSLIGKTGTLPRTDGGASALVGQVKARNGETLLFVIFNQRGNVARFRREQDRLIADWQNLRGGPAPFAYTPTTLAMRLSDTELARPRTTDEYEPIAN